jgi:outer membrane protein assembly factor BamB
MLHIISHDLKIKCNISDVGGKMYRTLACIILLALSCGRYPDEPFSPVEVTRAGTMMNGDVFVVFIQRWLNGPPSQGGIYNKLNALIVHPNGQTDPMGTISLPKLAEDCSDHPSNLGICVAATYTDSAGTENWSYPLADGSKIQISPYASGTISQITGGGSTIWMREDISQPVDAIRGSTLLILSNDSNAVSNIDINSGGPKWSVVAPAQL